MTFRKTIFWIHLIAGVLAGLSIFIMCFTGTVLAFEKQIIAFAERDVRQVKPGESASRLPVAELQKAIKAAHPDAKPTAIKISADPADAVVFQLGRDGALYANPYTGEIAAPSTTRTHDFMQVMEDWHRWLALGGDNRSIGKAINGACNIAFFILAITGLYIWWPRKWRTKGLRRSLWFMKTDNGKARDWNIHNVIGLWSAPVLIILTLTALPISYRWATNIIYTVAGEKAPVRNGPPGSAAPDNSLSPLTSGTQPTSLDDLLNAAKNTIPEWTEITLRLGGGSQPQPVTIAVKAPSAWPRTATTSLKLNPYTAEVMQVENFGDLSAGRRFRTWTRFLHTGEALGYAGQFIAGLASLGGCFLVYTGFALTWRRFRRWRSSRPA